MKVDIVSSGPSEVTRSWDEVQKGECFHFPKGRATYMKVLQRHVKDALGGPLFGYVELSSGDMFPAPEKPEQTICIPVEGTAQIVWAV